MEGLVGESERETHGSGEEEGGSEPVDADPVLVVLGASDATLTGLERDDWSGERRVRKKRNRAGEG